MSHYHRDPIYARLLHGLVIGIVACFVFGLVGYAGYELGIGWLRWIGSGLFLICFAGMGIAILAGFAYAVVRLLRLGRRSGQRHD